MNQEIYRTQILEGKILPWAQKHFTDKQWTFQQDSAPAHKAQSTQQWINDNCPDFISPQKWSPYSSYLNPIDCTIWIILQFKAFNKPYNSTNSL